MGERAQDIPADDISGAGRAEIWARLADLRARTMALASPLSAEDQCIQSMPDVSPTKWHLAHTSWFFEAFILQPFDADYQAFHPDFNYLFNSYYEAVGPRHARPERGLLSRPSLEDVQAYRRHTDDALERLITAADGAAWARIAPLMELGLHHEQQHQELLLTDIKHVFSCNPLRPAYEAFKPHGIAKAEALTWLDFSEGLRETGDEGDGFAFDNEGPRHKVWLDAFRIASRPVTNAEFLEFIDAGGYRQPEWWLSDGWAACRAEDWEAPLYWERADGGWRVLTLAGMRALDAAEPVCHVSCFEADAFARWAGKRLPTEAEWETMAAAMPTAGNFADSGHFHPVPAGPAAQGATQVFGDVWEWTGSAYSPYPGYRPSAGAIGEYNGKFMSGQMVLRGGSAATPAGHVRATYRNFFYPPDRWQFSGLRLAEDA